MNHQQFLLWKKSWTKEQPIPPEVIDYIAELAEINTAENRLPKMLEWMHKQNKLEKRNHQIFLGENNGSCW